MTLSEDGRQAIVDGQTRRWEAYRDRETCVNGHPWIPENIRIRGRRHECKICANDRTRAYREANRDEINRRRRAAGRKAKKK